MRREAGGGIGMGNTCKSMADSCQCMTKTTTIKQKKEERKKEIITLLMGLGIMSKEVNIFLM